MGSGWRRVPQLFKAIAVCGLACAVALAGGVAPALKAAALQPRVAIVGATGARLATAPNGHVIGDLAAGERVDATARTETGDWLFVQTEHGVGWVATAELIVFGAATLPVQGVEPADRAAGQETAEPTGGPEPPPAAADAPQPTTPPPSEGAISEAAPQVEAPITPAVTAEILAKGLNVRSGPGMEYGILTEVKAGGRYVAHARNEAGGWLQIELPDGRAGWVGAGYVQLSVAATELSVASAPANRATPAAPTPEPTPAAVRAGPTGLAGTIVFSSGNGGLFYRYDLATGELAPLTHGIDPAISPDGKQVVFTRVGGESGIYLINIDGSGERKIFGERELLSSPKWSPDGRWIVFSRLDGTYSCFDLGRNGICVAASELVPSPPAGLTDEQLEQFNARRPSILSRFDRQDRPNWALARINADGGDYRDVAALNSALAPDWSEAGIVYQSKAGIERTADAPDATTHSVLAGHNLYDPAWQPASGSNGGRIVYQQKRSSHWQIFAVNPDGSGNVALTRPATTLVDQLPSSVAPAWSPDGGHIVFLSNREENGEAGQWRLWVMDADGGNQRPLPVDVPIDYGFVQEQMVSWGR